MTLNEFISRWNGKYVDTDNAYGGQCMDLMHQFCVEILGISDLKVLAASSAKAVWDTFSTIKGHELFEQIPNTPTGVPQEGDIVLWTNAPYGHVAVFVEGNQDSFRSFDQNYPTGSPCHIQNHINYNSVGGWLRFKGSTTLQVELDKARLERDKNWNMFVAVCDALGVGANVDAAVNEAKKLVGNDDVLVIRDKQIAEANTQITDLQSQLTDLSGKHEAMRVENAKITQDLKDQTETINTQARDLSDLETALQTLKDGLSVTPKKGWAKVWEGLKEAFIKT